MQQNLKVLSERSANESFKKIREADNLLNMEAGEKVPKIAQILEDTFIEVTNADFINVIWQDKTLGKRMFHVFKNDRKISRYIIGLTDKTRDTYNNIKHKQYVANDKDYLIAVEATSLCIEYFSGVEIPLEIQAIYNSKIVITPSPVVPQPEPPKEEDIAVSVPLTIRQEDLIINPEPSSAQNSTTKLIFISKILMILALLLILFLGYRYYISPSNQMQTAISLLEQSKYDSAMALYKKLIENNFKPSNSQIILFENAVINYYDNLKTPGGGKMYTSYKFAQGMLKIYIPSSGKISYVNRFGIKMKRDFDGGDDFGQDKSQKEYARVFKINNVNPRTGRVFGNYFYIDNMGVCRVSCEIDK